MKKKKIRIKLRANFADTIASHGIGMNEMADMAEVSRTTLYALQNPSIQPNRAGGMHRTTAWKIVNAFSEATKIAPQTAWDMLIVEAEDEPEAGEE